MLGLAAERKSTGVLVVISPKDGFEFEINEDILNINMIKLGDFCHVEIENNIPVSYTPFEKTKVAGFEAIVNKHEQCVEVTGVVGVLSSKLALFYRTIEFGDVACTDKDPGEIGKECRLVISRLPENQRTGVYSKFVWQGISHGLYEESSKTEKNQDDTIGSVDEEENEFRISDDDENVQNVRGVTTTQTTEVLPRYITGFVTGQNTTCNSYYVACNLTYPGIDGIVYCSRLKKLDIGDFVEVRFSEADFAKYFPPNPTFNTQRFTFTNFKKIKKPGIYSVTMTDKGPEVKIKNFLLPKNHKKGKDIEDQFLGTISDGNKLISNADTKVDIVIRRRKVFQTKNGNYTTWFVKESRNSAVRSDSPDTERSSSTMMLSPSVPHISGSAVGQHRMAKQNDEFKIHRKGFKSSTEKETPLISKRAVVTSVKPSKNRQYGKDSTAYLWLLDDHVSSVYKFRSNEEKIGAGHFFEGSFFNNGEKWECKKHIRHLGKLMDGVINNDSIELQLTVYKYFPQSQDRLNPETYHSFIGKIIDRKNKLPTNCTSGVKISIAVSYVHERSEHCWIVTRVHQSKHIQILTEMYEVWQKPSVRNAIKLKCSKQFGELRDLLDTESEGQISQVHSKHTTKPSSANRRDCQAFEKFAWVTSHEEDAVHMIVFPRSEGQKMSDMKKIVTDNTIYENVTKLVPLRLYGVKLGEDGSVSEMFDCPQHLSVKDNGDFEFDFISSDTILLARNAGLVEPIGKPEWIGKLMFCADRPISKNTLLLKASFRLLDDKDLFVDDELVCDEKVCFKSIGAAEKLTNQSLEGHSSRTKTNAISEVAETEQNLFKTKLGCLSGKTIYAKFQAVCYVLSNKDVIETMKEQNVDTNKLIGLKSAAL